MDRKPVNGRAARSERTRAAIIDALITQLRSGRRQPTIEEIAARAQVAPRTVFQHFSDRDQLLTAAAEREFRLAAGGPLDVDASDPLADRIETFVDARVAALEAILPIVRAIRLNELACERAAGALAELRRRHRADLRRVFDAELGAGGEQERWLRFALCCQLSSCAAWDHLRAEQRLSAVRAREVMRRGLEHALG